MSLRARTMLAALALVAACDSGSAGIGQPLTVDGTVTSLSPPGSAPASTLLTLQWLYDDGMGDKQESAASRPLAGLPARFELSLDEPTRWLLDFDKLRALPPCGSVSSDNCWPDEKPRLKGTGRLADGTFMIFEDGNGDGQYSQEAETIRGYGPVFLLYAKALDAEAIKTLGELKIMNPQALRPGFNFARVRCKDKVGWKTSFDPFEIVAPESITLESKEAFDARLKAGEICSNWS